MIFGIFGQFGIGVGDQKNDRVFFSSKIFQKENWEIFLALCNNLSGAIGAALDETPAKSIIPAGRAQIAGTLGQPFFHILTTDALIGFGDFEARQGGDKGRREGRAALIAAAAAG